MNKYHNTDTQSTGPRSSWIVFPVAALSIGLLTSGLNAEVIFDEDFEAAALGTLTAETHPGWTGMLADNQTGSDPADWKIVEGAGLDWIGPDGGMIEGGNRHFEMTAVSNNTGRAFYDFAAPLPTDVGEATSVYLRYTIAFDEFENIADPEAEWTVWPLFRFNGSWQMRSILKFKHNDWSADKDVERFYAELHNDQDAVAGLNTVVFLEEKLGEPQPQTTYLVVTRYDFDQAGVLTGQAMWVNPSFADGETPDLVSNHAQPGYDTFVNPVVSLDITTYAGTMRFDNLKIANEWGDVVPQASGETWYGYAVDANGWVNADGWMSWVNVEFDPYIWSTALDKYVYVGDDSGWVYVAK
jgi:hypothetical protein